MPFYSRKSTRIPDYDYATPNYYFITICSHEKKCIFGKAGELNSFGEIAQSAFGNIEKRFSNIRIDNMIVMPNHIHAIIQISETDSPISLNQVIGLYKSGVSRIIHRMAPALKIWQRSFYDRVIRNRREYEQIWNYVQYNDQKWLEDCFYIAEDV